MITGHVEYVMTVVDSYVQGMHKEVLAELSGTTSSKDQLLQLGKMDMEPHHQDRFSRSKKSGRAHASSQLRLLTKKATEREDSAPRLIWS